ncbi:MAG: hypothetical protein A3E07_01530 [Candidatus Wildermuthbacteria bacterium RIFCSPHIGHO2_12_FULL_45_9]|uniref:Transcription elongation factor GreA n=1 Tax=Candidatus Wildermuthbacteria bacterium RIFCSPHIGHO2_02_FULL_45_25 TaxID=1802450 RepID=A0A1G2R592_9BACT|nr:MAG: hypothetical protein A2748_03630 [Candidatus Wildermuthbacteria bacterium RIFCSPHIGHO2_01_FULL_45_20]OHA67728.1 MAG: hypothetical protein A3C04_00370 [Candidatus Wildermuthbacteria bacterium RIFCSPHIGHO2_02_FULL_45_25]OHA71860.1 MAG: hypothetical protein A3E07_01530 [Candidatus Wildermuthbacteria bacterium RIFCSPHIGHO2_12_FULL_45_9]
MSKYVTKEGLEKLKEELEYLKTTKQQEIAERLRRAISYGDLSENFDYADAKEQQAMLQARAAELEDEIRESKVVGDQEKSGKVQIGSAVEVEINGGKMKFYIVTGNEADPLVGKISAESPIGSALLGKEKGETAEANLPAGPTKFKILDIE